MLGRRPRTIASEPKAGDAVFPVERQPYEHDGFVPPTADFKQSPIWKISFGVGNGSAKRATSFLEFSPNAYQFHIGQRRKQRWIEQADGLAKFPFLEQVNELLGFLFAGFRIRFHGCLCRRADGGFVQHGQRNRQTQ